MVASLTFLTPWAGLAALLALVPLAALAFAERRLQRARTLLRLAAPTRRGAVVRSLALVGVALLLALALMQPALRSRGSRAVRLDAAAFVVVDVSESMSAAAGPRAPSRLTQAKRIAIQIGTGVSGIPVGVATFTDRVLPNLFPTTDLAAFSSTIRSLKIDDPPPRDASRVATDFGPLAAVRRADYFTPAQKLRALVLITDGESGPFDGSALAHALAAHPAVHLYVVRVGGGGDRLYRADGVPGGSYRPDPRGARRAVAQLVSATGGQAFTSAAGVSAALRSFAGRGSSTRVQSLPSTRPLAGYAALAGLLPLLVVLLSSGTLPATIRRLL